MSLTCSVSAVLCSRVALRYILRFVGDWGHTHVEWATTDGMTDFMAEQPKDSGCLGPDLAFYPCFSRCQHRLCVICTYVCNMHIQM